MYTLISFISISEGEEEENTIILRVIIGNITGSWWSTFITNVYTYSYVPTRNENVETISLGVIELKRM